MNVNEKLYELISEGNRLRETLKYVPSQPNVIRTYSVYNFYDNYRYQIWAERSLRFLVSIYR